MISNPQLLVAWHWERYRWKAFPPQETKVDAFRRTFYAGARAMHRLLGPIIESIPRDDAFLSTGTFLNDGTLVTQRELLERIRRELAAAAVQSDIGEFMARHGIDPECPEAIEALLREIERKKKEEDED